MSADSSVTQFMQSADKHESCGHEHQVSGGQQTRETWQFADECFVLRQCQHYGQQSQQESGGQHNGLHQNIGDRSQPIQHP